MRGIEYLYLGITIFLSFGMALVISNITNAYLQWLKMKKSFNEIRSMIKDEEQFQQIISQLQDDEDGDIF